jgi:peroxiredoxin Q/BCP
VETQTENIETTGREKEDTMPKEGSKAPSFCLPSADKDQVCLKDFAGKWVVLYFYPKDSTSG